jgi:uncharacterized phage-like protein YoqJ
MIDRKFKNPINTADYNAYMRAYFNHEELCTGCGRMRKEHQFLKEHTDYVYTLFYRCNDGQISVMKV